MKIDKDIPIPEKYRGATVKWPWAELEVGDSFLMPDLKIKSASAMACHRGKIDGRKYCARTQPDGGVRVWRIQ